MNTLERTLTHANDSVTARLDELENSLPGIPAKALAATRASVRRVNDVVGSAAASTGQARAAAGRTVDSITRGVKETAGPARRTVDAVTDNVEGALDDAIVAADPADLATWTKAELYDRAQELDVDGRSGMTKAELIRAIEQAWA
jgi:hypothetical protein